MKLCLPLALLSLALAPMTHPLPVLAQIPIPQAITKPTLTVLHAFSGPDGSQPQYPLTIGADGALYGTTLYYGAANGGTVFKVTKDGLFHNLADLHRQNGSTPAAPLLLMPDGSLMGSTFQGGKTVHGGQLGSGSLFLLTPPNRFQTKHEFASVSSHNANVRGANPTGPLALGPDGAVYGTTERGGSAGQGVAYRWTAAHGVEVLHDFAREGGYVFPNGLTLGPDGALYGVTVGGGASHNGTVYRLSTDGVYTLLHTFTGQDGQNPQSPPVVGKDGVLYGVTLNGGKQGTGAAYQITTDGAFTLLHSFNSSMDGGGPVGLAAGPDGSLYGACVNGGQDSDGTVFRLTPAGTVTRLYSFDGEQGGSPYATVTVGSDGTLYGITTVGRSGYGTVFKLRLP